MSPLKTDFENWRGFLNESLIIESRFSDALAYAQNFNKGAKQFKVKDVIDQMSDEQIAILKKGVERAIEAAKEDDPSGDNKYLMWVARFIRKDLMRRLQKYGKQWNTTPVLWNDPDAVKDSIHDPDYVVTNIASLIVDNVVGLGTPIKNYHLLKQKGVVTKDIYDFDPTNEVGDFKNYVEGATQILRDKEKKAELKKQAAGEADDVLETEDYAVIRPNTEGASCYYGWGTRWCISARESKNYFNQYAGEGKAFYFVMFRHLSKTNSPNKKMALVYGKDQTHGDDPEQVFDALDDEVGEPGLVEGITDNLLFKIIERADALKTARETIKNLDHDLDRQDRTNVVKDEVARIIEDPADSGKSIEAVLSIAQVLFPDTYEDETDFEIQPFQDKFDELVQEQYSDIVGNAGYHAEENPSGPKHDDYEKVFDQYAPFNNIYVNYDEYDTGSWYWDASFSIASDDPHFKDLQIPEDVDMDDFANAIHKGIDGAGIYPDEVESDGYENEARVRLTPDYDETNGIDGFERFLSRMNDADEILGDDSFWDSLSEALMDAGLTSGGLKELEDKLDEIDFKNIEYGMEGTEFNIVLELDPVLGRPKGISGMYFGRLINTFTGGRLSGPKLSDPEIYATGPGIDPAEATRIANAIGEGTLAKIENVIRDRYSDIWNQLDLPGFERDEVEAEEIDSFPMIDMAMIPRPDKIVQFTPDTAKVPFASKERDKGGSGINIIYPYNLVLTLTNEQYWASIGVDEEEQRALIAFLKWIDQDEVKDQIEALLQETLNNAVRQSIKDYPQRTEKDLEDKGLSKHYADVEDEPQVAEQLNELYKRWGKMIK